MVSLLGLNLLGPGAVPLEREVSGGTILFLMLYLFLLFGIYFLLKRYKDGNDGNLTWTDGIIQGITVSISTAIFSVLFTYLFYELIYPDYVTELTAALQKKMELANIPKEKIIEKLVEIRAYYATSTQSIYSFIGNLITGTAFTLLLSFFLKTNRKKTKK